MLVCHDILCQKCPGNLVLPILEYSGILFLFCCTNPVGSLTRSRRPRETRQTMTTTWTPRTTRQTTGRRRATVDCRPLVVVNWPPPTALARPVRSRRDTVRRDPVEDGLCRRWSTSTTERASRTLQHRNAPADRRSRPRKKVSFCRGKCGEIWSENCFPNFSTHSSHCIFIMISVKKCGEIFYNIPTAAQAASRPITVKEN